MSSSITLSVATCQNVLSLQTSSDMNEEAANSQVLSTRNSFTASALSPANTAQPSILHLLH